MKLLICVTLFSFFISIPAPSFPQDLEEKLQSKSHKVLVVIDDKYRHDAGGSETTFVKLDVGLYIQTKFKDSSSAGVKKQMLEDGTIEYTIYKK